jgi:hypothetical protein
MARYLPFLDQEIEETRIFTWYIPNWRGQNKKLTSPKFICGGHNINGDSPTAMLLPSLRAWFQCGTPYFEKR